jgi:O-antigen ligase/polysaccharide polymerase Wzy-like membrane protein
MRASAHQILPQEATAGNYPKRRVVLHRQTIHPTSRMEHVLLLALIILIPLEDTLPSGIAGRSVLFLVFALLGLYIALRRPWAFVATWSHPVFLAGYGWLAVAGLMEWSHLRANYSEHLRIAQMLIGGVLVASLCRDKRALRVGMYGYVLAGLGLSVLLFFNSYGVLQASTATNFEEANQVRAELKEMSEDQIYIPMNRGSFFVAQGAVIALVLALDTQAIVWRNLFLGASGACLVASFLPLSRGSIIIAIASCAIVTLRYGMAQSAQYFNRYLKTLLLIVVLGCCVLALVPKAAFMRMAFPKTYKSGTTEGRAAVYTAALKHLPDYLVSGVGAGNFWKAWGRQSDFSWANGSMHGAHNGLIQVTIYWGVSGLLTLCIMLYLAYRCLPRLCGTEALSLGLFGISVTLGLYIMMMHVVSFKGFSIGLGLLVGARRWIWPHGVVSTSVPQLAPRQPGPEVTRVPS